MEPEQLNDYAGIIRKRSQRGKTFRKIKKAQIEQSSLHRYDPRTDRVATPSHCT